jgi:RNA polymerase sigma-70 factor, ECF subfamily
MRPLSRLARMEQQGQEPGSPEPDQLERLLADARAGSQEAEGRLLELFRPYLLLLANTRLDAELAARRGASDLVQDTFLNAHQCFEQFNGTSVAELRAWLRRILLNVTSNSGRGYRDTARRGAAREVSLDAGPGRWDLAGDTPSPSERLMLHEEAEAVQRALARLPEDYREVILLRQRDNLPFEEIGRKMGRSADAARMLWCRAVEHLQQELEPLP